MSEEPEIVFPEPGEGNPYMVLFPATDVSVDNPSLHLLYVKWAAEHLVKIDAACRMFAGVSNINMNGPLTMLLHARQMLVDTNKAYADADEIVVAMHEAKDALAESAYEE